ncbi:MAG TPA: hypothetical protein VGL23_13150 [Chloroflexota bacterium]
MIPSSPLPERATGRLGRGPFRWPAGAFLVGLGALAPAEPVAAAGA